MRSPGARLAQPKAKGKVGPSGLAFRAQHARAGEVWRPRDPPSSPPGRPLTSLGSWLEGGCAGWTAIPRRGQCHGQKRIEPATPTRRIIIEPRPTIQGKRSATDREGGLEPVSSRRCAEPPGGTSVVRHHDLLSRHFLTDGPGNTCLRQIPRAQIWRCVGIFGDLPFDVRFGRAVQLGAVNLSAALTADLIKRLRFHRHFAQPC